MLMLTTSLYRTSNHLPPTAAESVASSSPPTHSCAKLWPYLCHRCVRVWLRPQSPPSMHMIVLLCTYSLNSNCYILNFVLVDTFRTCRCYILPHFAYLRHMPVFCLYKSITVLMIPTTRLPRVQLLRCYNIVDARAVLMCRS
jgi:hypothetical protein